MEGKKNIYVIFDRLHRPESLLLKSIKNEKHLLNKEDVSGLKFENSYEFKNINIESEHNLVIATLKSSHEFEVISLKALGELTLDHGAYLCQALAFMWKEFDAQKNGIFTPPRFIKKFDHSDSLTFYGGSFNPWHDGHRACIDLCPEKNIIVVPDYNPWKNQKQTGVGDQCRWKTFKDLALLMIDTPYSFYPGFWGINRPNPTSEWISKVQASEINLIIGDDSFMSIEKWYKVKSLFDLLKKIYVVPRNLNEGVLRNHKKDLEKKFNIMFEILGEHQFQNVSSTKIREKLELT